MSTKQTWRRGNRFLSKDQIIAERDGEAEEVVTEETPEEVEAKAKAAEDAKIAEEAKIAEDAEAKAKEEADAKAAEDAKIAEEAK